ncbi:VOC family protein [Paenibacillus tarimensis]|uniref:VOC family protein n=1 Tax=Paenibacillus tarimensis TaxID=416012 RepID=UPI001F3080D1|nr:VOC family protein [Paenibacillus tarimensis]MCF2944711.1 VOC family protein [Paenibacillus tarimensis]
MIERIDKVMLPVPNAAAAAEWYVREFEFDIARIRERCVDLRLTGGDTLLTLTEPEAGSVWSPLLHLDAEGHVPCFNLYTHWEDLHARWLNERGIQTTEALETPVMKVSELSDPYGNVVGVCHEKPESLFYKPYAKPVPPMFHHVLAVFIPVLELDSSIEWYTAMLGFKLHNHWGEGADLMIGSGETIVTMIQMSRESHEQAKTALRGRPYYSLQTPNVHETYRALSGQGVRAVIPDHKCSGSMSRFNFISPEGLIVQISEKELIKIG